MVPLVVQPGGGDVGVAQPLLHLGNVGAVRQGVGRGGGPQRMDAEALHRRVDAHLLAVAPDDVLVDRGRVERLGERAGGVVFDRPEQRSRPVVPMPGGVEIGLDQPRGPALLRCFNLL